MNVQEQYLRVVFFYVTTFEKNLLFWLTNLRIIKTHFLYQHAFLFVFPMSLVQIAISVGIILFHNACSFWTKGLEQEKKNNNFLISHSQILNKFPISHHCPLPRAHHLLPTVYFQLTCAHCLLLTA